MEAPPSPVTVTTAGSMDPLTFLDPYERLLCGWAVMRMFATCTPRFAKGLNKYGPEGMAYYACYRTFYLYIPLFVVALFPTAFWPDLYYSCLSLGVVCLLLGTRRGVSMIRAGKRYRRSRSGGD
jgi:hypothetical protein